MKVFGAAKITDCEGQGVVNEVSSRMVETMEVVPPLNALNLAGIY